MVCGRPQHVNGPGIGNATRLKLIPASLHFMQEGRQTSYLPRIPKVYRRPQLGLTLSDDSDDKCISACVIAFGDTCVARHRL